MPKKEIYLHIGVHKTATSTIQRSLFENKARLLKAGWLYPDAGMAGFAHHNLRWQIRDVPTERKSFSAELGTWSDLCKEIDASKAEKVIVSSETFSTLQEQAEINKIRNTLLPYDVHVIVYLRRQDEFIYSSWAQQVKTMEIAMSLQERAGLGMSPGRRLPNYAYLLKGWARAFGKENIILRIFQKGSIDGHIFHDFLRTCGVPDAISYPFSKDENVTPDIKTLEIIRILNQKIGLYEEGMYQSTLHSIGIDILGFYKMKNKASTGGNFMDNETAEGVLAHFEKDNQNIAREYLGRDVLFKPFSPKTVSTFDVSDVSGEEMLDLFGFVLGRMLERREMDIANQSLNLFLGKRLMKRINIIVRRLFRNIT